MTAAPQDTTGATTNLLVVDWGLPGSGKTTLANARLAALRAGGTAARAGSRRPAGTPAGSPASWAGRGFGQ